MDWVEIGSAVGAAVGGLLLYLKSRKSSSIMRNARRYVQLYGLAQNWMVRHGAQRVLLLYARNSGSPWKPELPVKVSCVLQAVSGKNEDTFARWQEWSCDSWYRTMLSAMLEADHNQDTGVRLVTSENVAGVLHDAYVHQGTASSVVFKILDIPKEHGVLYCSLNFGRPLSPGEAELPQERKEIAKAATKRLIENPEDIRRMVAEALAAWRS